MAVDEALLDAAARNKLCAFRLYQWEEPTLSLGYFQGKSRPHQNTEKIPERYYHAIPKVRRLSGGGAILHDQELTYSCVLPSDHPITKNPSSLYTIIHNAMIQSLSQFGIESQLRGIAEKEKDSQFLCFSRGDAKDIVIQGHKIVGSAQRRRKGAVLQHGSLILKASEHEPKIKGIYDLCPVKQTSVDIISSVIIPSIIPLLGDWKNTPNNWNNSPEITKQATSLQEKYCIF